MTNLSIGDSHVKRLLKTPCKLGENSFKFHTSKLFNICKMKSEVRYLFYGKLHSASLILTETETVLSIHFLKP